MTGLLFLVIYLNLYDIIHTIQLMGSGLASEGNPLMRYLLDSNPAGAIIIKSSAAVLFAAVIIIYSHSHFRRALAAASLIAALYALLTVWHLIGPQITVWYLRAFH